MATWRYEISLLVLKKYFTRSRNIFSTLEENFVSPRGHVMPSVYVEFKWSKPHDTRDL